MPRTIRRPEARTRVNGHRPATPAAAERDRSAPSSGYYSLFAVFALLVSLVALIAVTVKVDDQGGSSPAPATAASADPAEGVASADELAPAVAADDPAADGIDFEPYRRPDPSLPAVPPGDVKRFTIDVYEHVAKVSDDLAPTRLWSFGVNGDFHRGTGVSPPLVVDQGDLVEITLRNGASEAMGVTLPHSIDFHSSEVAPDKRFIDVPPGDTHSFRFRADHPGVYMYHCATQPVLMHTGAGMVGMMVVKPANLAPVDRELWVTQQEFYPGKPGEDPGMAKMEAKQADVVAFNGYANQYLDRPITVGRGERVRLYVLNAGPSLWSAFHVIGTVFDRAVVEGVVGRHAQTINLAPSQGGYVELTLAEEGTYPFVSHSFGDAVKGAVGALTTEADAGGGSGTASH
jgi:nitrite reductase (NO-forming)